MRFFVLLALSCFTSCAWEEFPPEKYRIPIQYRELISSFIVGDTLKYTDGKGHLSSFLIQNIDSVLHNKRGHFVNMTEYKSVSIACRELENARKGYEEYNFITIVKDPATDSTVFNVRLKDFYSIDPNYPSLILRKDTVTANDLSFTNYYYFRPLHFSEQPNSVTEIYMTNEGGIVAYRSLNRVWWTKLK